MIWFQSFQHYPFPLVLFSDIRGSEFSYVFSPIQAHWPHALTPHSVVVCSQLWIGCQSITVWNAGHWFDSVVTVTWTAPLLREMGSPILCRFPQSEHGCKIWCISSWCNFLNKSLDLAKGFWQTVLCFSIVFILHYFGILHLGLLEISVSQWLTDQYTTCARGHNVLELSWTHGKHCKSETGKVEGQYPGFHLNRCIPKLLRQLKLWPVYSPRPKRRWDSS